VLGGVVEERRDQMVGPDHDRAGRLAGGLPGGDAFGFPHDRQRPVAFDLDEGGRVGAGDDPVGDGVVKGLAQGAPDELLGGSAGGALPFDGGPHVRVGAGLGLADLGVAGLDGGEHGPDVAGPHLVQGQGAQVWDEVDPYVGFVAAVGGFLYVDGGDPIR